MNLVCEDHRDLMEDCQPPSTVTLEVSGQFGIFSACPLYMCGFRTPSLAMLVCYEHLQVKLDNYKKTFISSLENN